MERDPEGLWIEPFVGSGSVVLNVMPKRALLADTNPYLVQFHEAIRNKEINGPTVRTFLEHEGKLLAQEGQDHYYYVRDRFNSARDPLDFLFLNRSCFNGLIRFNRHGAFNVPFGHKPMRFSRAYITKIVNQVSRFQDATRLCDWTFVCQDHRSTIETASRNDFVYCDPPYVGRHVDYYGNWDVRAEQSLHAELKQTEARFMVSTWHSNQHRENQFIQTLWDEFTVLTHEHFYHIGAREVNRKPMLEALVVNYEPMVADKHTDVSGGQLALWA